MTEAAYGGYRRPGPTAEVVRLDLNEAPQEIDAGFRARLLELLGGSSWRRYPDMDGSAAREAAATLYGWRPEGTLVGNGSNELLAASLRALLPAGGVLAAYEPSFSMYPVLARRAGARLVGVRLEPPDFAVDGTALIRAATEADVVIVTSPNNPTGGETEPEMLEQVLRLGKPVIWDAAYLDFTTTNAVALLAGHENLVVLRSLSKAWALAGLRVGALLAGEALARRVSAQLLPFDTGRLVDAAFRTAVECAGAGAAVVRETVAERERLRQAIAGLAGWAVVPSCGNFFLLRRPAMEGSRLREALLAHGVAVRDVPALADAGYVRVTVGSRPENDRLLAAMREVDRG